MLDIKAGSLKGADRKVADKESYRLITIGSHDKALLWKIILERDIIMAIGSHNLALKGEKAFPSK